MDESLDRNSSLTNSEILPFATCAANFCSAFIADIFASSNSVLTCASASILEYPTFSNIFLLPSVVFAFISASSISALIVSSEKDLIFSLLEKMASLTSLSLFEIATPSCSASTLAMEDIKIFWLEEKI